MKLRRIFSSAAIVVGSVAAFSAISPSAQAYSVLMSKSDVDGSISSRLSVNEGDIGRDLDPVTWVNSEGDLVGKALLKLVDPNERSGEDKLRFKLNFSNTSSDSVLRKLVVKFEDADGDLIEVVKKFDDHKGIAAGNDKSFGVRFKKSDFLTGSSSDDFNVTVLSWNTEWEKANGDKYNVEGTPEPITILGSGLAAGFGVAMKRKSGKNKGKQKEKATA
ncbi:MAG: PEP-CTERM sorting domain-containing protein [Cyanobacteria bacterium J06635_1]